MSHSVDAPAARPAWHVGAFGIAAAVLLVVIGGFAWMRWSIPGPATFEPLVEAIEAGALTPDKDGRIDLSHHFAGVTPRDEMFVFRRDDGSRLELFPTYYNTGTDLGGLLYTSRPLQPGDTYMKPRGMEMSVQYVDIGSSWKRLGIDQRIDPHWYRVSRGLR